MNKSNKTFKPLIRKPIFNVAPLTLSKTTSFRHFQTERVCRRKFQI